MCSGYTSFPNGKEAAFGAACEATAAKYDKDPMWLGVIARFPRALRAVSKVSAFGSQKHQASMSDMSYRHVPDADTVYLEAVGRHLTDRAIKGRYNQEDGGLRHLAQLAWNSLAALEVELEQDEQVSKKPERLA
jgi:hypothetical protein